MSILYSIIIGAIAGWGAGKLMKGGGFGLLYNILLGIVGGFIGNWIGGKIGISIGSGIIGDLIRGVGGSVLILFIAGLIKKK